MSKLPEKLQGVGGQEVLKRRTLEGGAETKDVQPRKKGS